MRRTNSIKRLERRIEQILSICERPQRLYGVIYTDEDPNLVHAYGPDGYVISAASTHIKKTLRKSFELSKKEGVYLIISQFSTRSNNNGDLEKIISDGKQNPEPSFK